MKGELWFDALPRISGLAIEQDDRYVYIELMVPVGDVPEMGIHMEIMKMFGVPPKDMQNKGVVVMGTMTIRSWS